MKRNLKGIITAALVCAMTMGCLAACGKEEINSSVQETSKSTETGIQAVESTPTVVEEELSYPLDTDETITVAMLASHFKAAGDAKDITDSAYFEAWQEQTGVTIEVDVYETEDAMKLMVSSGDVPDILMWSPAKYSGGEMQMISDGILSPLTWEELEKWAPDYAQVLKDNDMARKLLTTADGDIVGFGNLTVDEAMTATSGIIVRRDWMDDLGIKDPTTPEDFLDMLRAFKTEKGAEYPLALNNSRLVQLLEFGNITSPFGLISAGPYQVDGEYHLGYAEEGYKGVLEFLHTMYEEELMNRDYQTVDQNTVNAMLYDGRAGVVRQSVISGLGTYIPAMKESDPNAVLGGIGSLYAPDSDKAYFGANEAPVHAFKGLITQKCENKELAMKFLNYNYTEAGQMLTIFGIEGKSYEMLNNYPTYTDEVLNNPNGYTLAQALHQYARAGAFWPFVARVEYFEQTTSLPEQRQAVEVWRNNDRAEYYVPTLSVATEDSAEYTKIKADVDTYVAEMRSKFISGEESLDNFDAYIQGLKERGIDRMIEIMQNALNEFNSR